MINSHCLSCKKMTWVDFDTLVCSACGDPGSLSPADIWKGHAEVWRGVQEDYRKFAEDEEHALNVSDPEADPIRAKIVRGLRDFAEIVAEDYEAKASNPAKESEG